MPLVVGVYTIDVARLERAAVEHGKVVSMLHLAGDEVFLHGNTRRKVAVKPAFTAKANEVDAVTEGIATVGLNDTQPSSRSGEQTGVEYIHELETKGTHSTALKPSSFSQTRRD